MDKIFVFSDAVTDNTVTRQNDRNLQTLPQLNCLSASAAALREHLMPSLTMAGGGGQGYTERRRGRE